MASLELQRKEASSLLPAIPLRENNISTGELRRFEVVLAYNLEYPYRYCQDFWWLEVLAIGEPVARKIASRWVLENSDPRFECTDWIRPAGPHIKTVNILGDPNPIAVRWDLPVDSLWREGSIIRHPATSKREGFISDRKREENVLRSVTPSLQGEYRVLTHRPLPGAEIVCIVPAVDFIHMLEKPGH